MTKKETDAHEKTAKPGSKDETGEIHLKYSGSMKPGQEDDLGEEWKRDVRQAPLSDKALEELGVAEEQLSIPEMKETQETQTPDSPRSESEHPLMQVLNSSEVKQAKQEMEAAIEEAIGRTLQCKEQAYREARALKAQEGMKLVDPMSKEQALIELERIGKEARKEPPEGSCGQGGEKS